MTRHPGKDVYSTVIYKVRSNTCHSTWDQTQEDAPNLVMQNISNNVLIHPFVFVKTQLQQERFKMLQGTPAENTAMTPAQELQARQNLIDDIDNAYVVPSVTDEMLANVQPADFMIANPTFPAGMISGAPLAIGAAGGTKMVYQYPIRYTGKEKQTSVIRYWAERGMIRASWHDDALNMEQYDSFTVYVILERIQAINDMVKNSRASDPNYLPQEMDKLQRFVEEMIELVRIAREQGTPDSPSKGSALRAAAPSRILVP